MAAELQNYYRRAEAARRRPARWKTILVTVLVVLGSLLALLSLLSVWLNRRVVDTDAYVATVAPLADDPAIQAAVATAATDQLFNQVNVQQEARQLLPEQAAFLAAPISEAMHGFVQGQAERLFASAQFSQLWQSANRQAHELLMAVVLGENLDRVSFSGGKVTLELGGFATALSSRLEGLGIDIFAGESRATAGEGGITIFESEELTRMQDGVSLLNRLAWLLPLLSLISLLTALTLAPNRYRTAIGVGLGLAAAAAALRLLLGLGRSYYLEQLGGERLATERFFDIVFQSLLSAAQLLFWVALLLIGVAILAGPSTPMVRLRQAIKARLQGAGGGLATPAGPWLGAHKNSLRLGAALATLLALILRNQPSLPFALALAALLLLFLGALELLAQTPHQLADKTERWRRAA